jgi:hypothetical protein
MAAGTVKAPASLPLDATLAVDDAVVPVRQKTSASYGPASEGSLRTFANRPPESAMASPGRATNLSPPISIVFCPDRTMMRRGRAIASCLKCPDRACLMFETERNDVIATSCSKNVECCKPVGQSALAASH